MKILLSDLVGKTESFSCESCDSLLDDSRLLNPVQAKLRVNSPGRDKFLLSGSIEASLSSCCDRCSKDIAIRLDRNFKYTLIVGPEPELEAEHQCSDEECQTLYLDEAAIETDTILAEQLLLAMPIQRLCDTACKGLCQECGINLNEETCDCGEYNADSPFAVLKALQKE